MKQPINEIKKMQRLAGLITESEYQESIMDGGNNEVEKLKDYIERNSFGLDSLNEEGETVHFEFINKTDANEFKYLLNNMNLNFKLSWENDGGSTVYMFDVDKQQIKQLLGI
jgi:hypothetical protein